jgi:hypothetical protein
LLTFLIGLYDEHINSMGTLTFSDAPLEEYDGLSEKQLVEQVTKSSPLNHFAQKTIVAEAKRLYWQTKETTKGGRERERKTSIDIQKQIHELVQERMRFNEAATDWVDQRRITTSWLQTGGREDAQGRSIKESVYNFRAVDEYFSIHGDEVEAHHQKLGIDKYHNMKVPKELKKRAKRGQ